MTGGHASRYLDRELVMQHSGARYRRDGHPNELVAANHSDGELVACSALRVVTMVFGVEREGFIPVYRDNGQRATALIVVVAFAASGTSD